MEDVVAVGFAAIHSKMGCLFRRREEGRGMADEHVSVNLSGGRPVP
jgi:hypothetical protein